MKLSKTAHVVAQYLPPSMNNTTQQPLLSPKEVAVQLGVSESTILSYLRSKKMNGIKLPGGKLWRIDPKDIVRP